VAGAIGGELLSKLFLPRQSPTYTMHEGYIWLVAIVFSLVAGSIALFINFSWVRLAQSRRDVERAERAAIEAQLRALQAQIEPHFLFNTLANLDALIATDAGNARCLLGNLIRYLRAALTHARSEAATLHTEVELLKAYLAIMALRLPNRLTTEFDCDPDCLRLKFPAMLLQPLVENAITHGIEPAGDGGTVRVTVRCEGDKLMVSVDDTGVGLGNAHTAGTGAGIQNIRARLQSLFGSAAHLVLEPRAPRGTHAAIEVPLNLLSRPAA
jgi:LytS/YehU family sensor histidine kinase